MTPPPPADPAAVPAPGEGSDGAAAAAGASDATPANDVYTKLGAGPNYLKASSGIGSWMFTLDHKRIGIMYLVGITVALLLGGALALIFRTAHMWAGAEGLKTIVDAEVYNQLFTLHGAIMVFLVIIPGIPASIGNFVLPLMLGAKDVAFPRINLMSFWLWIVGTVLFLTVMVLSGLDTGWTFYTPYSVKDSTGTVVVLSTLGAFVLGFASIFTGMNFMVTIHKLRPPGMSWFDMPLMLWALYATALIQILATPVLGITLLLLLVENTMQVGIFNPQLGGDPVLFQHFFWFYSHPAVYIMILPAFGVTSELVAVHSHKHIFGYRFIAFSSVAIALLGFLVWGHHMYTSGQSNLLSTIFSAITFTIAIPSAIKVFNWLATMYKGSISLNTPMLFTLGFIFIFVIGGLTGLYLSTIATDIHLHDTYFVVAHFHFVMAGTIFALFGAVFHWWPKITGRMYNETLGRITALTTFVGFAGTFLPQFVMGSMGMPRRYWEYDPQFLIYHQLSTVFSWLFGLGMLLMLYTLFKSLANGRRAVNNPWAAASLEWRCPSPPPHHNFAHVPRDVEPYDFPKLVYDEDNGDFIHSADIEAGVFTVTRGHRVTQVIDRQADGSADRTTDDDSKENGG